MHDIGRTQLEYGAGSELDEFGELGETGEFGVVSGYEAATVEPPLSELQEVELATTFLEIGSDAELEQFLGGLMGTVGRAVGRFVDSDTGRALGGVLKQAARDALPVIGGAVGGYLQPGGRGSAIGADIARKTGQLFGLELEGLSHEDREFELARQFIRFATAATRQAILAPASDPRTAATSAASVAARSYAPGLLTRLPGRSGQAWPRQGRWVRRGRVIVLYGG